MLCIFTSTTVLFCTTGLKLLGSNINELSPTLFKYDKFILTKTLDTVMTRLFLYDYPCSYLEVGEIQWMKVINHKHDFIQMLNITRLQARMWYTIYETTKADCEFYIGWSLSKWYLPKSLSTKTYSRSFNQLIFYWLKIIHTKQQPMNCHSIMGNHVMAIASYQINLCIPFLVLVAFQYVVSSHEWRYIYILGLCCNCYP
jgi:hypothetical protein